MYRKASMNLLGLVLSAIEFFKKAGGRLSGENMREHGPEFIYAMVCRVPEEVVEKKKAVLITMLTQFFWGSEASNYNWEVGDKFIGMLRSTTPKVDAGEMTEKEALDWAYENRKPEKKSKVSLSLSELSDQDLEALHALLAERVKASQSPAPQTEAEAVEEKPGKKAGK